MPSKPISMTLAHNLRFYRAERGFSQQELCKLAKLTTRSYQTIESGRSNPTLATIDALAGALKVTVNKLLSLDIIKLDQSTESFINAFKKVCDKAPIACSIRSHDGIIHFRNVHFKKSLALTEESNGTVDLLKILPPAGKEILRTQLASERRGLAIPYVNSGIDEITGEKLHFRFYPCLIYPVKGRVPVFSVMYMTEISEDCENHYYEFCRLLLKSLAEQ